jgi:hypothetical protein
MSGETIASSASTWDSFASGLSYDPEISSESSLELAEESLLETMITQIIDLQKRLLDKDTEIAKLKLENFNLKLKNDTDDIEIAVLELENKFDMIELGLLATIGYEV